MKQLKINQFARVTNPLPEHREFDGMVGKIIKRWEDTRGDWARVQFGDESRWWIFHTLELEPARAPKGAK